MVSVAQLVDVHGVKPGVVVAQVREVAGDCVNVVMTKSGERYNGLRPASSKDRRAYWSEHEAEPEAEGEAEAEAEGEAEAELEVEVELELEPGRRPLFKKTVKKKK